MKVSAIAVIATAVVGVTAVPLESGPMASLQARAADAIGGVVHYIRSEQAGTPVVPEIKRSPIRFHSGLDHENAIKRRKNGDGNKNDPPPPLNPFVTGSQKEKRSPDLTRRNPAETSVPPLAPFSTGE
ncbi:uncharacterized protein ColSpa_06385 [Colletotrichum spaethianum]|uniref:Uncharacterized protein n=1 Tax=Colletotrichum spaethianum TaxID=700344 RepID=A0AA37P7X6_9PEZI|nr:uncharacterized protein ColSpa_06385 [Colletotrichum spaethianum]GKT46204.1 hypothetical protein ColSpa_06385 [Colletotrichum spaethianum]